MRAWLLGLASLALAGLAITAYAAQQAQASRRELVPTMPDQIAPAAAPLPRAAAGGSRSGPPGSGPSRTEPAQRWVVETSAGAGIPEAAVRAYGRAVLRAPEGCHLGWTTLAAIGWVESHHGSLGGRTLLADGRSSAPIIGPALDGRGGVRAIAASAAGTAAHGDPLWEHALGPMQFLPVTWSQWEVDADGDGAADPHDIDDAAMAAADYLCASGDLSTDAGWQAAVLSYNHSADYVRAVHAAAGFYAP